MISNNKTEYFLVKKSIIIILILICISIIIFGRNFEVIVGVVLGYLISLLRLRTLSGILKKMVGNAVKQVKKYSPVSYIFVQLFTILILILAVMKSAPFFLAVFTGILVVPLTILINSLTELLGITRNNFE